MILMDPQNTLNRAYAHWLKDGLFEIGFGILLTGVGTLRAIIHFAGQRSAAYYWLSGALLVFMIGVAWGGKRFGEALKERITYPRTGYMAFKPRTYNNKSILAIFALFIFAGVLGGVVGLLATQPNQQEIGGIVPITQGIVGALAFTFAAQRIEIKRFYYLAVFSLGIGLAIGALGVGVVLGLSFFYLSIGLALVMTGCVALVQFLRSHEPVDLNGESQ
jgi:FtsH-binding integral membrane protein